MSCAGSKYRGALGMRTSSILKSLMVAVILTGACAPAEEEVGALNGGKRGEMQYDLTTANGDNINGTAFNGINFNGINFNGINFNGINFNGINFNGINFNGTELLGING